MNLEKVAEVMGFEVIGRYYCRSTKEPKIKIEVCKVDDFKFTDTPMGHWLSHLLVEKMVGDGWDITINIGKERGWCEALRFDGELYHRVGVDHQYHAAGNNEVLSAPAAIVSLFCKVYGITEE